MSCGSWYNGFLMSLRVSVTIKTDSLCTQIVFTPWSLVRISLYTHHGWWEIFPRNPLIFSLVTPPCKAAPPGGDSLSSGPHENLMRREKNKKSLAWAINKDIIIKESGLCYLLTRKELSFWPYRSILHYGANTRTATKMVFRVFLTMHYLKSQNCFLICIA